MTDSMKCPFCGEKLQTHTMTPGHTLICVNKGCPVDSVVMKRIVWQALIAGKKAQDVLMGIGKIILLDSDKPSVLTVKGKKEIKRIITSTTKQEKQ